MTLRQRVRDYRAGELERRYAALGVEEDYFVNYGFMPRTLHALMHPREPRTAWTKSRWVPAAAVLDFVRERGVVHPREVDARFAHGRAKNWFGGTSKASTQFLDGMQYRGLLRVARREGGVRLYAARDAHPPAPDSAAALDTLVNAVLRKYAPLPERSLSELVHHLRYGAPQWADGRRAALERARQRLPSARVDGTCCYWPAGEDPASKRHAVPHRADPECIGPAAPRHSGRAGWWRSCSGRVAPGVSGPCPAPAHPLSKRWPPSALYSLPGAGRGAARLLASQLGLIW